MKAFHTIAIPHKDILAGRLTLDVFAADLKDSIRRLYRMVAVSEKYGFKESDLGVPTYGEVKALESEVKEVRLKFQVPKGKIAGIMGVRLIHLLPNQRFGRSILGI